MRKTRIFSTLIATLLVSSCSPQKSLADLFYKGDAAPWETVDAFYYPDRGNLTISQNMLDVDGVAGCREIVRYMAAVNNDPQLQRGDYECGVGRLENLEFAGINVYRLTLR